MIIEHLSEKPWSDYTSADYSVEQWHAACLIHQHEGAPTSKGQCKLPVKTPNGAVNRNAVHSAAAALAGARGGVHASSEEKASAAKSLIRYYHQMDEEPPPSLLKHSNVMDFIEQTGVKGMKWGVRTKRPTKQSSDFKQTLPLRNRKPAELSNKQIKRVNERINLETNYRRLNPSKVKKGEIAVKSILATAGIAVSAYSLFNSPAGKAILNLGRRGANQQLRLFA